MKDSVLHHLDVLTERYPALMPIREDVLAAFETLAGCFARGGKLLVAGSGGSCADADHIVGELMKGFVLPRKPAETFGAALTAADPTRGARIFDKLQGGLPAISLCQHAALNTAYLNDVPDAGNYVFAQQTFVLGEAGDVLLAISTSGNSENLLNAAAVAHAKGMSVIALVGHDGGKLAGVSDATVCVGGDKTYQIQELHLPVYHALCLMLEEEFFGRAEV